ncbi:MAG: hypothetical protein AAGB15_02260 [Pseudomonadota bacterium]
MYEFDDSFTEDFFMSHDAAVYQAMSATDKGLFDNDESRDEDLAALYDH